MAYLKFAAYHVPVLHVHQCLTNHGFTVFSKKQARYHPVINCTYWPVLGPYNNWNIIHLTPKSISSEAFNEIHQVVIDGISESMASLVQLGMYGAINTDDTTKMDSISFNSYHMHTQ